MFEAFCHLSITINLAIVSFTSSGGLFSDAPWSFTDRLIFFILAEHGVYAIINFISRCVPDISAAVVLQQARADYLVPKHVFGERDVPERGETLEAAINAALADMGGGLTVRSARHEQGGGPQAPRSSQVRPAAGPVKSDEPPLSAAHAQGMLQSSAVGAEAVGPQISHV